MARWLLAIAFRGRKGVKCQVTGRDWRGLMPPLHLILAKPKSGFLKLNLHTIDIIQCRTQLANDKAWFKSGGFKPQAPTLPSTLLKVLPLAIVIGCL